MRDLTVSEEKEVSGGLTTQGGLRTAFEASQGQVVAIPTDPILPPNPVRPFVLSRGTGVNTVFLDPSTEG